MCIRDRFYLFAALVEDGDKWLVALAALALVNTAISAYYYPVSYTHLRAHETVLDIVCRLLLEKKKT